MTRAASRLLVEGFRELAAFNVTAILSGVERGSAHWNAIGEWADGISRLRDFYLLDAAIEWAEDQIVYRHGGAIDSNEVTELSEQALLAGVAADELDTARGARHSPELSAGRADHQLRGNRDVAVFPP